LLNAVTVAGVSSKAGSTRHATRRFAHLRICDSWLMRALSGEAVTRVASRARALGDPTRVRILAALTTRALAVGSIAKSIDAPQSTVSKHLQILFNAGLVGRRREASTVIYSIASPDIGECLRLLGLPIARRHAGPARIKSIRRAPRNHPRKTAESPGA